MYESFFLASSETNRTQRCFVLVAKAKDSAEPGLSAIEKAKASSIHFSAATQVPKKQYIFTGHLFQPGSSSITS